MPRLPRLWSLVAWFAIALLVASLSAPAAGRAQDDEDEDETPEAAPTAGARQPTQRPKRVPPDDEGLILFALVDELPTAPSFVRLLRIYLEPGAISPLHFHPGPEIGLVEDGVTTVLVEGPTDLLPKGRTKAIPAEEGTEFELERGDQILYPAGSPMQFRNAQDEDVATIMSAVLLPAGHQHPPGLTWVDGPPAANALQGLSSVVLGDGCARSLPAGPGAIAVDRIVLEAGEPIPAYDGPVLISVETGTLDFVTVSGEIQSPRLDAGDPCEQPPVEPGTELAFGIGSSAYFPNGMAEVARPESAGELSLLRLTIAPAPPLPNATPEPEASPVATPAAEPAVIEIPGEPTPTAEPTEEEEEEETAEAEATEEETEEPTEEPAEEPTEEPDEGGFAVGSVAQVNETGVNLRAGPTTSADVVAVLDQGAQVTITDEPVEADGIIWYPVESTADPSVSGWIAGQFLEEVEE